MNMTNASQKVLLEESGPPVTRLAMLDVTSDLANTLNNLVGKHGMVAVLQTLANLMADTGNVTGGMVSEIAAIEAWLQTQNNPGQRQ
jgi:hypothetical protein